MYGKRSGKTIVPLAVLALGLTAMAWGHGFPRGMGFGGFGGRHGACSGRLLDQLIFPCRAGCSETAKTCFDATESTAGTCVSGSCGTQIAAAQTACRADRKSSACQTAVSALKTCAQSCGDTQRSTAESCQTTLSSCLTTCGNS